MIIYKDHIWTSVSVHIPIDVHHNGNITTYMGNWNSITNVLEIFEGTKPNPIWTSSLDSGDKVREEVLYVLNNLG